MGNMIDWLTNTPMGLAATIGTLVLLFILVAVLYEWRTRKLYPDRNRRGTKAAQKAKAKKKSQKQATKKAATESNRQDDAESD